MKSTYAHAGYRSHYCTCLELKNIINVINNNANQQHYEQQMNNNVIIHVIIEPVVNIINNVVIIVIDIISIMKRYYERRWQDLKSKGTQHWRIWTCMTLLGDMSWIFLAVCVAQGSCSISGTAEKIVKWNKHVHVYCVKCKYHISSTGIDDIDLLVGSSFTEVRIHLLFVSIWLKSRLKFKQQATIYFSVS